MKLPTFLVIGAAKAGTTALYHFLHQHPQIYMSPVKETNFFCFEGETPDYGGPGVTVNRSITTMEDYCDLFAAATDESALGEVSPMYMALPLAAERIRSCLPDARLIALLRHPVDRAYSAFLHLRRDGREPIADFSQALQAEPQRTANRWGFLWRYRALSRYAPALASYYDAFPSDQIRVFSYDDFRHSPRKVLRKVFEHIRVDPDFRPRLADTYNVSGEPRSDRLARAIREPGSLRMFVRRFIPLPMRARLGRTLQRLNLRRPHLDPELRWQLTDEFVDDILQVEGLCDIDLSSWLPPEIPV